MSVSIRTSRIGRKPIKIPSGVDIKIQGEKIHIKGPKGQINNDLHPYVEVVVESGELKIHPNTKMERNITGSNIKLYKSIAGTVRANIANMVQGVTTGYERKIQLVGVGY